MMNLTRNIIGLFLIMKPINLFCLCIIVLTLGCSSGKQHEVGMSVKELEEDLYNNHNIESFRLLEDKYFNRELTGEKMMRYTRFALDSLNYILAYDLIWMIEGTDDSYFYYTAKSSAYMEDCWLAIVAADSLHLKKELVDFYHKTKFGTQHWDTAAGNLSSEKINTMFRKLKITKDDQLYSSCRDSIPLKEMLPFATYAADSLELPVAMYDVYRLMCLSKRDTGTPLDSAEFDIAYGYLQRGINKGFLPCIFWKSLLLLTGTYLPEDTVEGKYLFEMCTDQPLSISFWEPPSTECKLP